MVTTKMRSQPAPDQGAAVQPKPEARDGARGQRSHHVRMALDCLTAQGIGPSIRRPAPRRRVPDLA